MLALAYFLLSDRPWQEVISYENLARQTPWRPFPLLGLACGLLIIPLVIVNVISTIASGGRYMWSEDGTLRVGPLRSIPLANLEPGSASIVAGFLGAKLTIRTRDLREVTFPIWVAAYERVAFLSALEKEIATGKNRGSD